MELDDLLELLESITEDDSQVEQVDALVLVIKEAKETQANLIKPYKALQDKAKQQIEKIIKQTGIKNWNEWLQNGYAYRSADYQKVTYDWELLDKYLNDPSCPNDVKLVLMLARKETQVKGSLVIK